MDIILTKKPTTTDLAILPIFKEEEKTKIVLPSIAKQDFKNTLGHTHLVYVDGTRVLLVGLGEKKRFNSTAWRIAIQSAIIAIQNLDVASATLYLPSEKYLELTGFALTFSSYQFNWYKKDKGNNKLTKIEIIAAVNQRNKRALNQGMVIGTAANSARDLANHPGNTVTPSLMAKHALKSARQHKFSVKILGPKEIAKEGMGLILGVAAGSDQPPRFIIFEYGDRKKQPIVLIGKGLTFDSGGISIKPAEKMEEMKYDMCGAADVLGIFEATAKLKLPIHLVGIIPATENLLSGKAVKPGDILVAHDGTSVEIINTDAEGRLVLADAFSFAQKYYKPRLMIDYATLTGSVLVALGNEYTGYFANTKTYDYLLQDAAKLTSEQFWSLPLAPQYKDQMKSSVADIKNVGEKGLAGATTAALFLEHFVKDTPWIHFDIGGTAWTMRPKNYAPVGATAWGVYLTIEFLRNIT